MSQFGIRRSRIDHILISHLHGDHIFGLPGLINSFNLNQRKKPLNIYGPIGIRDYLDSIFRVTQAFLGYEVLIHEIGEPRFHPLFSEAGVLVHAFPMQHRIPTYGYLITESEKQANINPEAIDRYNLTVDEIKRIKADLPVWRDGQPIDVGLLTLPPKKPRSIAYCSDTIYDESLIHYIEGVDLLYHEATYLHDLASKASDRMHSTAQEAATIAKKASVNTLLIGHYSSRYKDLTPFLEEAQLVFQNTLLALEGRTFPVGS